MENTIYTDGYGIKVTTQEFITGKTKYLIEDIITAQINSLRKLLSPAVILIILGIIALITGALHLYSNVGIESFQLGRNIITANRLVMMGGLVFLVTGIVWIALTHKKYAVLIITPDGFEEPVISPKREYVSQIVAAIQKAKSIIDFDRY